ncbi:MAG TPA: glycosyltransferase [Pyrinomonadaceae bacterium]|nr:glycosyltransferase [Pyrinomonadaceae bacterium]
MKSLLVFASLAFGVGVTYLIPGDGAPAVILCAAAALLAATLIGRTCEDGLIMRVFVAALLFRLIIATVIYAFEMHEYFGVNGFVASTEDEWVDRLGRLLRSPSLRARLGAAGRLTVEADYSSSVHAPRVYEVLKSVSSARAPGRRR